MRLLNYLFGELSSDGQFNRALRTGAVACASDPGDIGPGAPVPPHNPDLQDRVGEFALVAIRWQADSAFGVTEKE